jgi:hypothetical protein
MRNIYAATALIALTLAWLGFSGLRTYQKTCDQARVFLRQNGGQIEEALKYGDSDVIRHALSRARFGGISSISFWGVDLLEGHTTSAVTVGDARDPVVCELPLGNMGTVAFQMRPIQFVQAVVAKQLWVVVGLWLVSLLTLLWPMSEEEIRALEPERCEAFSTLKQVVDLKRSRVGGRVQMLLLRPPGEQRIRLGRVDFEKRIGHLIDHSVSFGANSVCLDARVHGHHLLIKMTDNHAQETLLALPI